MTDTPTTVIFEATTGEITQRNLTSKELTEVQDLKVKTEAVLAEIETKKAARESALAKLAALGLTEAEIAAL
jgi:hypothetical protein